MTKKDDRMAEDAHTVPWLAELKSQRKGIFLMTNSVYESEEAMESGADRRWLFPRTGKNQGQIRVAKGTLVSRHEIDRNAWKKRLSVLTKLAQHKTWRQKRKAEFWGQCTATQPSCVTVPCSGLQHVGITLTGQVNRTFRRKWSKMHKFLLSPSSLM